MTTFWVWFVTIFFICTTFAPLVLAVVGDWDGNGYGHGSLAVNILFGLAVSLVTGLVSVLLWVFVMALTTGVSQNYSRGEVEGYINASAVEGIIWKTNEYSLQVENEKQMALREFRFSAPNEILKQKLDSLTGKRIKIVYTKWIVMPFSMGSTDNEVLSVEEVP